MRRKGELSEYQIDREWPHQVVLPASACTGQATLDLAPFCTEAGLEVCPRHHVYYEGKQHWLVFCFGSDEHAETFRGRFGGKRITPAERPRWPGRKG